MKIVVKSKEKPKVVSFPTALILSKPMARFLAVRLQKYGVNITKKQAVKLAVELKRYRKKHSQWVLVEVQTSKGDHVEIEL